jgi:tubulin polyglutamylase TTLL1
MSLKSVQSVIINDKHCFEMYGYDVLLDSFCKPWLLEINASPSLSTTTKSDLELKMALLKDTFDIVIPEDWGEDSARTGANTCTSPRVGGYSLLYDESAETGKKSANPKKSMLSKIWR